MRPEDFIAPPCECPDCRQAGVNGQQPRRDPRSGAWAHGYELKRWLEARARFLKMREAIKPKEMP